ncbi:hypothetical protein [Mesorhizobium neociceri]|uniref:Uncharacterized protein n=1 Tax=Mesorhizobium neociceri TaxID=1307853 RepID=A0A838BC61_9HYPH|nr:hypothetical protein [Mesorhizobium neociceri]MBA1144156.1 hypothetical protein [Mesorhizobium neociceri]
MPANLSMTGQRDVAGMSDSSVAMPLLMGPMSIIEAVYFATRSPSSYWKVNGIKQPINGQSAWARSKLTQRFLDLDHKNGQQGG